MDENLNDVVWFVAGDENHYVFDTKMGAEIWARKWFPYETPDKRYSRVRFTQVKTEDEAKYL